MTWRDKPGASARAKTSRARKSKSASGSPHNGREPWVSFWNYPGLVDLVRDDTESLCFFVVEDNGRSSLVEKLTINEKCIEPPRSLLFDAPTGRSLSLTNESDCDLFSALVGFVHEHVQLPGDRGIEYQVLAAWVMHTYLLEHFEASPYLFFTGAFESGKSRASEVLKVLARHGLFTVGLTGAALFRANEYNRPSLFLDELHLSKDHTDFRDLLNARYKRGGKVVRVNTDRPGPDSLESFEVFGPTVISTTASLPQTVRSRCLTFSMLSANRPIQDKIDRETAALLRDRLTAFRSRHLLGALSRPEKQSYNGRLREIMTPLHQIILMACPEVEADFIRYIGSVGAEQKAELQGDDDCEVVRAILAVRASIVDGVVEVRTITSSVNSGREAGDLVPPWKIGQCLSRLGFKAVPHHGGGRSRFVDEARLDRLAIKYGLVPEPLPTPSQPVPKVAGNRETPDDDRESGDRVPPVEGNPVPTPSQGSLVEDGTGDGVGQGSGEPEAYEPGLDQELLEK